jgi:hypothetical protein
VGQPDRGQLVGADPTLGTPQQQVPKLGGERAGAQRRAQ